MPLGYGVRKARWLAASALVASTSAVALVCDVDNDGEIGGKDISLITTALDQLASGPSDPRDADQDGIITISDARICALRCVRPNCDRIARRRRRTRRWQQAAMPTVHPKIRRC